MLASQFDDELSDLAGMVRAVAIDKIGPLVPEVERSGTHSSDIQALLAEAGLFGLVVPSDLGGQDSDVRHQAVTLEELARVYPSACTYLTAHWLATKIIARAAVTDAAEPWMPGLLQDAANGAKLGAIAATEPDAGSDLAAITTRARLDGDDWVISGTKRYITNGGFADFYAVLARTGGAGAGGISLLFVEADRPGVTVGRWEQKMGLHGSATAEMIFDDVRVPRDHLVGELDRGFRQLMTGFDEGRIVIAAMCVGIAQGSLDAAVRYASERRAFGKEIAGFQGVQFLVADMSIAVHAARSLTYDAAQALVDGHPDTGRLAAIAKTFASDACMAVTSNGVQVHGGAGYVRDFPVEMFMRDAKIGQIYEGTNQLLRMLVARSYFGELAR